MSEYLLVLGDRVAIHWALSEQRMAFPAGRTASALRLRVADSLWMYSTSGARLNRTRDRGRVFGLATETSLVGVLESPVTIAARDFHSQCSISVEGVAHYPEGVDLATLVGSLRCFSNKKAWSARLLSTTLEN